MGFNRVGAIAAAIYLAIGLLWVFVGRPPGQEWLIVAWFVLVGAVEVFVPGEANQVSLARAYLAAPAVAYSLSPGHLGLLAVAVALAGLSDLVDGTVARRFERPTNLGGGLDPVVDGLFMGALAVGLAVGGAFPGWLALIVVARYALPVLAGGLLIARHRRPELHHTLTGQVSTSLILILLGGVCLFRGLNQDPSALTSVAVVVIPLATLATFIHLGWVVARRPVATPVPG